MEVITKAEDVERFRSVAAAAIDRYGHLPDHQLALFECGEEEDFLPAVLSWPDGTAILAYKEPDKWTFIVEPLAPQEGANALLVKAMQELFTDPNTKKIHLELRAGPRKELRAALPAASLRDCSINYSLTWPVMDLAEFDTELNGGKWKTIRKERNRFYREHTVEVKDAKTMPTEELNALIVTWSKSRNPHERTYPRTYYSAVERKFDGMTSARVLMVDGVACGLNVGWEIPNRPGWYYGGMGIHTYAYPELGNMLYLEDILWIKNAGYANVDMGGSWGGSITFKKKFFPDRWYKSFIFSIVRA